MVKNVITNLIGRKPVTPAREDASSAATPKAMQPEPAAEEVLSPEEAEATRKDEKQAQQEKKRQSLLQELNGNIEASDYVAAAKTGIAYARVAPRGPLKERREICRLLKRARSWSGILLYLDRVGTVWREDKKILPVAATAYRELQRFQESAAVLQEALQLNDTIDLRRELAGVLASLGQFKEAVAQLNQALTVAPDNVSLNSTLIKLLVEGRMFEAAEKRLTQAVVSTPDSPKAHAELGEYYKRLDRKEDACAAFYQASQLAPDNEQYTLLLQRAALACSGDNFIAEAIAAGEHALENKPNSKIAALMARLYARLPDPEQAIAGLDRLLQAGSDDEQIIFGLAQAYLRSGNLSESRKILENRLEKKPGNRATIYRLAGVLAQQSEPAAAVSMMMKQVGQTSRDAVFHSRVGHILAWMGMTQEATTWLREAIELDRSLAGAISDLALCHEYQREVTTAVSLMEQAAYLMAIKPPELIVGLDEMYLKRLLRRMMFAYHVVGDSSRSRSLLLEAQRRDPIVLPYPFHEWTSGSLEGKRVVALTESGIGDEIRYTCVFHRLLSPASEVLLACDPRLESLLKRSFPDFKIFPTQREFARLKKARADKRVLAGSWKMRNIASDAIVEAGEEADIWLRVVHLFEYDSFDQSHSYQSPEHPVLIADPEIRASLNERIQAVAKGRPVIGLSWRGGHRGYSRDPHYFTVEQWKPILDNENFCFVNLQYAADEQEMAYLRTVLGDRFIEFPEIDLRDDLEAVAALCAETDAVVAICTAVLELAGAVGARTLYLMRSPQVTHSIRLKGTADIHGSYQDDVWRNCRIIPRFAMTDDEVVGLAAAYLGKHVPDAHKDETSETPRVNNA